MKNNPKKKGVLLVDQTKLQLYVDGAANVITFTYPPTVIKDLDVINTAELDNQIKALVTQNKISPAEIAILLSPAVLFEKKFVPPAKAPTPVTSSPKLNATLNKPSTPVPVTAPTTGAPQIPVEEQIETFLNNVPFNHISSYTFKSDKEIRVVVANFDLYNYISDAFGKMGFITVTVSPALVLGENISSLSAELAKSALKKGETLKQIAMVPRSEFIVDDQDIKDDEKEEHMDPKQKESMLKYVLIGMFLLLSILGYMIYKQFTPSPPPAGLVPSPTSSVLAPTLVPTESAPVESTSSAQIDVSAVKLQVLNGSGTPGQAEKIRTGLQADGFKDITVGNAGTITGSKTSVVFLKDLDEPTRQAIVASLEKLLGSVSTREATGLQFDAIITTAKSSTPSATITP